jgi:2-aminoadipate transaminase
MKTKTTSALSELGRRTADPPISWLMKLTLDHPNLISLAAGFTDNASLPVDKVRQLLAGALLHSPKSGQAALQYGATAGDPELRRLTAQDLQSLDGGGSTPDLHPAYSEERVLITNGSQQFLYLVTECLCDPGDIVLVEDPTYFVYLGIAQSHGIRCGGIPMEADGLSLDHLEAKLASLKKSGELRRVKMLCLVSYFQNPSGITTSFAKKTAALELLRHYERAAGHPLYLLEDAAYRELRFSGTDVPSALASFSDRVIYSGTYSKPFATGARVGFGLLPEPLFQAAHRVKGNHDFGTANLLQHLLVHALKSGEYEKHLAVIQSRYRRKARTMVRGIREHFPASVRWNEPEGGLYVWARLPKSISTSAKSGLFKTALKSEVLYVPGSLCYAEDATRSKPRNEMRLSFGGATESGIREGIRRLGGVIGQYARN